MYTIQNSKMAFIFVTQNCQQFDKKGIAKTKRNRTYNNSFLTILQLNPFDAYFSISVYVYEIYNYELMQVKVLQVWRFSS